MQKIFYSFFFFLLITSSVFSARRGDVKVIEASENIRYLSQKIVKEYLFLYQYPSRFHIQKESVKTLNSLNNNFKIIARITKNSDTKDILDFLAYGKDNMIEILKKSPTKDNCSLMLDYSEMLIEGVNSIEQLHKYNFSKEEKMLIVSKKMEYLIERMGKYYLAIHLDFDKVSNQEFMDETIGMFDKSLKQINLYDYPEKNMIKKLNYYWTANKILLDKTQNIFVSDIMFLSLDFIRKLVSNISVYYNKNQ